MTTDEDYCKCERSYDVENRKDGNYCKLCGKKKEPMSVVILCGGKGTRMGGFASPELEEKSHPKDCKHERIYILKVRCEQCGKVIDEPFGTTYTLRKEERTGVRDVSRHQGKH